MIRLDREADDTKPIREAIGTRDGVAHRRKHEP
jgi:hypothetical protein